MAKTELGCQVLQEKGHFAEFSQFIRVHGDESEDGDLISKLKSILWAVVSINTLRAGFFGSPFATFSGKCRLDGRRFTFLRRRGNYSSYLGNSRKLAYSICSRVCSLSSLFSSLTNRIPSRTCFFVLGLISSTSQGAEILDDYHWEATLSPLGFPTGLCIPADIERFIFVSCPLSIKGFCS